MRPPTEEDLRVIAWQLGRSPRGALAVKPCPYGFSQVILNAPILRLASRSSLSANHARDVPLPSPPTYTSSSVTDIPFGGEGQGEGARNPRAHAHHFLAHLPIFGGGSGEVRVRRIV